MPPVSFHATTRLEFNWGYPDPPEISFRLLSLQKRLLNTQVLSEAFVEAAQRDMEQRFEDEVDPSGSPWQELKRPAIDQVGILRLSTDMYEAAISDDAYIAEPHAVFFDTTVLPPYWVYHEQPEGGSEQRIPRRAFVGISGPMRARFDRVANQWLDESVRLTTTGRARAIRAPIGRKFLRVG